jgi:hypothetical protein
VGGRHQQADRRQGTTGAVGLDVGIDADAFVVAGRNLDLALGDIALPLRLALRLRVRRRHKAHQGSGNKKASGRCGH